MRRRRARHFRARGAQLGFPAARSTRTLGLTEMKFATLVMCTLVTSSGAETAAYVEPGVEYRTGNGKFERAWQAFYGEADHEPELDDPLIAAGAKMALPICEAIAHKDMKRRRYAIGALGFIAAPAAMPCLEAILKDKTEIDYFRGDALKSIYQIDHALGRKYAAEYQNDADYLKMVADAIFKKAAWLTEPTEE